MTFIYRYMSPLSYARPGIWLKIWTQGPRVGTFEFLARRNRNEIAWWPSKGLFIWKQVTWLVELLGKGEIPAEILKYCFAGSLFIWDRRVTRLAKISAKRPGISARESTIVQLTIVPCKHFFQGLITRHPAIRFSWKRVCFTQWTQCELKLER